METLNKQVITIDLRKKNVIAIPQFIQGDNNILEFVIEENGVSSDLSNVGKIIVNYKRSDRKVFSKLLENEGNIVTYPIGTNEMEVSGIGELELQFFEVETQNRLSSLKIKVSIIGEIGSVEVQEGIEEISLLQELFVEVENKGKFAQQAGESALTNWLSPVADYSAVQAISNPQHGDTVQTEDDGKVYRYEVDSWKYTQGYGATALANVNAQLAEIASFETEHESAPLGSELVTSTGWVSTGWTGDFATGFTHTTGNTTPLTYPLNAVAGKLYQVVLTVDDVDTMNSGFNFNVTIGDSAPFQMYQGTGGTIAYSKGIKAINNGDLKIIPTSTFTGEIYNISVKEVIGTIPPTTVIKDTSEQSVYEARPTKASLNNVFVGKNSGQRNASGMENTIIGNDAMSNSVSGFWNSALGYRALLNNINGSRSIAIGFRSLEEMISGHRNIAVGTFALHRVTTGANNIGIGADSAWHTTTGEGNIAIGTVSLDNNTTGSFNIAIGYNALRDSVDKSFNVGIGHHALRLNQSHNNTAIGAYALSETTTSGGQTAIGYQALKVSTGTNNTAIGQQTALNLVGGNNNTVVGRIALLALTSGSDNTVVGSSAIRYLATGSRNTVIGESAGNTLTDGSDNILIGDGTDVPTASTSNHLNIGKLIYGDLNTKRIGIGLADPLAKLHVGAGNAEFAPIRINSSGGVLMTTPMNGCFEYDGTNLYFTVGTTRKIVSLA